MPCGVSHFPPLRTVRCPWIRSRPPREEGNPSADTVQEGYPKFLPDLPPEARPIVGIITLPAGHLVIYQLNGPVIPTLKPLGSPISFSMFPAYLTFLLPFFPFVLYYRLHLLLFLVFPDLILKRPILSYVRSRDVLR